MSWTDKIFEGPLLKIAAVTLLLVGCTFGAVYGWLRADVWYASAGWAMIGAIIVFLEAASAHKIAKAMNAKRWGKIPFFCLIWVACASASFLASLGNVTNAQNAKASLATAKLDNYQDAKAERDRLRQNVATYAARIESLQNNRGWIPKGVNDRAIRPVAAVEADLERFRSHRWFGDYTEGCANPKGRQSRQFCNEFRAASAELEISREIDKVQAMKAAAEQGLAKTRSEIASGPAIITDKEGVVEIGQRVFATDSAGDVQIGLGLQMAFILQLLITSVWFMLSDKEIKGTLGGSNYQTWTPPMPAPGGALTGFAATGSAYEPNR
jgi:hypothetical protein